MVSTQYGALLKEFESFFGCTLEPDENNSCLITLGIGIQLQIELDREGMLVVGCRLGLVHMGRYRESLVQQALKANEADPLSAGVLGFSKKSSQLILFKKFNPGTLNQHQIQTFLPPFIQKARKWKEAVEKGELPSTESAAAGKGQQAGLFGLISKK